ncbi:response regulator [Persicimonas caeni]|uniref:Response regulator n=1 Tax=Persicimonas caeni TaxID=2292766 RepID=A0A4Y6Q0D9_PERCE|nr:response regulator [Persicimonas caeni]QDG53909.1 response regulator [Persicimonas caeni]QED35130.1 response regulator [Persicimonas caeni]
MKNVLIVDDEESFLKSLIDGLEAYSADLRVWTAFDGCEAIELLEDTPIDLVVTDLKMPQVNGFELLEHINREFPSLPVLVMTAFGSRKIARKLSELGVSQFLDKPVDFDHLVSRIFDQLDARSRGRIKGIALPTFLQLIEMEKKTCTLQVRSGDDIGLLYFLKGELINAEISGADGEEAASEIVTWQKPDIALDGVLRKQKRTIHTKLGPLLMEAYRLLDERGAGLEDEESEVEFDLGLDAASGASEPEVLSAQAANSDVDASASTASSRQLRMALEGLASLEGFVGAGVFSPSGEALALLVDEAEQARLVEVGGQADAVLGVAGAAASAAGSAGGPLIHIDGDDAHILMCTLDLDGDGRPSESAGAFAHAVLILADDSDLGRAKKTLSSVSVHVGSRVA